MLNTKLNHNNKVKVELLGSLLDLSDNTNFYIVLRGKLSTLHRDKTVSYLKLYLYL